MGIEFLRDVWTEAPEAEALAWGGRICSYAELRAALDRAQDELSAAAVTPGTVVALQADFSPRSVALLLALIDAGAIVVPLTTTVEARLAEFLRVAEVELVITVGADDEATFGRTGTAATHALFGELRAAGRPGLILFSSGSTGAPKAALHDFSRILEKFKVRRVARRMISFLLFDHIGGLNTLLYCLSNLGCAICVRDRSPDAVCTAIAAHRAQVLPTSPTFLNLLLLSCAAERHDLSTLELVTYGTEPMPETTLHRLRERLPGVELLQTYGLSEIGILRSKSRASDSLWVRLGGEGYALRVVDGLLEVKAESAMLGYLNAPSPFTADGWFKTGDQVEVDGEWLRILGRRSEMINVGGEKVHPAEVEGVLQAMDGVAEAVVVGEANPITGMLVKARVRLSAPEEPRAFRQRMRAFCGERLPAFKIPQKVEFVDGPLSGERFKKMRAPQA